MRRDDEARQRIVEDLLEGADVFHTREGETFASFECEGHRETWPVKSMRFWRWIHHRLGGTDADGLHGGEIKAVIDTIDARAAFQGPLLPVFNRVGKAGETLYLDLADDDWHAIEITYDGWSIVADPEVKFRRTPAALALPQPTSGGSLDHLRVFLNSRNHEAWTLMVAWLLACFRPSGPYPVLVLQGPPGTAKSCAARFLRSLVDPAQPVLRATPREERDLAINAHNTHVLAFDNLRALPLWLSDALCRVSTGGGYAARRMHSDDEEYTFNYQRPVILTSTQRNLIRRPDLRDRAIVVTMPRIEHKRTEADLNRAFEEVRPGILGALLNTVCTALRNQGGGRRTVGPICEQSQLSAVKQHKRRELPAGGQGGRSFTTFFSNKKNKKEIAKQPSAPSASTKTKPQQQVTADSSASRLIWSPSILSARMADFVAWIQAAEEALPWETGKFLSHYATNRGDTAAWFEQQLLELLPKLFRRQFKWEGTATELLQVLEELAPGLSLHNHRPPSPAFVGKNLRRMNSALAGVGILLEFRREGKSRKRVISLERIPFFRVAP